ncbi:unnamed protein product, partial [Lampetra fluviatilis]
YCVAMCGDGANDCGALRAADVGVSLSEAEASVASPFTSRTQNITCLPAIIREGRASLVTSFIVFKFMALYSFIQFTSVLILYTLGSTLGDAQFLFVDLFVVTSLAVLIGRVGPHASLGSRRPHGSLMACAVLGSLLSQALLQVAVQLGALLLLRQQAWFTPLQPGGDGGGGGGGGGKIVASYENTVIFCSSSLQYLIVATALSQGRPFRRPIYTNPALLLVLAVLLSLELWMMLAPPGAVASLMELRPLPSRSFSGSLVGLAAINLTVSLLIEALIDSGVLDGCARAVRRKQQPKNRFKREDAALRAQRPPWPPLGPPPTGTPAGTPTGTPTGTPATPGETPRGGHGTTPLIVTTLR